MTREEAIKCLKTIQRWTPDWDDREDGLSYWDAIDMALTALRPVSREQVEKLRGTWEPFGGKYLTRKKCSRCGWDGQEHIKFYSWCPNCGSPMTDEAVGMMLKRMEEIYK